MTTRKDNEMPKQVDAMLDIVQRKVDDAYEQGVHAARDAALKIVNDLRAKGPSSPDRERALNEVTEDLLSLKLTWKR
jgi:hypothetical protein